MNNYTAWHTMQPKTSFLCHMIAAHCELAKSAHWSEYLSLSHSLLKCNDWFLTADISVLYRQKDKDEPKISSSFGNRVWQKKWFLLSASLTEMNLRLTAVEISHILFEKQMIKTHRGFIRPNCFWKYWLATTCHQEFCDIWTHLVRTERFSLGVNALTFEGNQCIWFNCKFYCKDKCHCKKSTNSCNFLLVQQCF